MRKTDFIIFNILELIRRIVCGAEKVLLKVFRAE